MKTQAELEQSMTCLKRLTMLCALFAIVTAITGCGFHLQGELRLAQPLRLMYLQTPDPYGHLARDLEQYLKMSNVRLVASPEQATTILTILQDANSQNLLSVSGTQQTRQYNLIVSIQFEVTDNKGRSLIPRQSLREARAITIQSNQILGSSNEAALMYQQIRRSLAYAIINRLASREITQLIDHSAIPTNPHAKGK